MSYRFSKPDMVHAITYSRSYNEDYIYKLGCLILKLNCRNMHIYQCKGKAMCNLQKLSMERGKEAYFFSKTHK